MQPKKAPVKLICLVCIVVFLFSYSSVYCQSKEICDPKGACDGDCKVDLFDKDGNKYETAHCKKWVDEKKKTHCECVLPRVGKGCEECAEKKDNKCDPKAKCPDLYRDKKGKQKVLVQCVEWGTTEAKECTCLYFANKDAPTNK